VLSAENTVNSRACFDIERGGDDRRQYSTRKKKGNGQQSIEGKMNDDGRFVRNMEKRDHQKLANEE